MNFYARRRRNPQVIIVALIDIFAILLIFMVMTTQFKEDKPPEVTIKLPESKSAVVSTTTSIPVLLTVSENEELYLDNRPVAIDGLKDAVVDLMKQTPPPTLALNADKKAPFGTIIRVLDALREAGVKGNLSAFTEGTK